MHKLLVSVVSTLLGLGVAWFTGPADSELDDPPPPTKAKIKPKAKERVSLKEAEAEGDGDSDPADALRKTYDLLRRQRADSGGARPKDRPQEWTTRAVRLYRDGVSAYDKGDLPHAQALGSAALQLARAVEFARNAERDERDDSDLPPPPPSARYRYYYSKQPQKGDAPPDLPPPLDDDRLGISPGPGRLPLPKVQPRMPMPPEVGRPPVLPRRTRVDRDGDASEPAPPAPPALPGAPQAPVAPVPPQPEAGVQPVPPRGELAIERIRNVRVRLREAAKDDTQGDNEETKQKEKRLKELRQQLADLERSLAGDTRSAANEQARRDLKRAYDRIQDARAKNAKPEAKFYLDAARDLYNAARRDAEAGRNDRASELARAAEALTLVPQHLASIPPSPARLRIEVRKEFVEPKGKAGRVEPKKSAIRKRAPKDAEDKDDDEGDPDKQTSHDLPQVIGIGVAIESADGAVIVRQVLPDTPAGKDGRLKVGDEIVGIQNDNGEQVELKGKALPEVTRSLRGSEGQRLRLVVVPKDSSDRKVYELTRE
ncbi:MAG TPA: PDZ domain-containing protein, partial [Isosphaeraceae bacterium]|nr:PDZ domain-containing protein [Isosphaeraceae bacterium]